jgi:hypothetical protein
MNPKVIVNPKELKDYLYIGGGELYKRLPGGVLARCLSMNEAAKRLEEVHEKTCGFNEAISLYL